MLFLFVLFGLSTLGTITAFFIPEQSDWLLLTLPCAVASLVLLLLQTRAGRATPVKWAVIDGSNVMHWNGGKPDLRPVKDAIRVLSRSGFTAGVVFDANAGYKLQGRYLNDRAFCRLLNIPRDRVMIVPKNSPADPMILTAARDYGARVVTEDRFRDWVDAFPEIREPGFLIRGRYEGDALLLDLSA